MHTLDSFFESIQLPVMPEVALALIKTLNNDDATAIEVRNIIAQDPALTARLLRLANSAHFGLPRGVGTLDEAIAMVGMAQVRSLSLCTCISAAFPVLPGLNHHDFWRSSMACAAYAQWLAGYLGMDVQQAWLTGMMLRLGELLIGQADPNMLLEIEKLPHQPGCRWARETRLTGFSEGQITAELARRWNFPMQMVQALQRSSEPLSEQAFSRLGSVVHLAGLLADTPYTGPEMIDTLPLDVMDSFQVDVEWMRRDFPDANSFLDLAMA